MNHRKSRHPSRRTQFAPGPCPRVNRAGVRCRHRAGHAGPCEPGAAVVREDVAEMDDPSDAVLEYGAARDEELRREEET